MKTKEYYLAIQELVILLKYQDYEKFMENLESMVSEYEEHDEVIFLLGHYAYNLGNYPLAMEYFTSAWDLNKTIQEYADGIAITAISLNDKEKALSYAKISEMLSPHQRINYLLDTSLMNYQGLQDDQNIDQAFKQILINYENGRYYVCVDLATKLLHSAKDNHELFLYLGKSYYNLYEYELAYEALKLSYKNTNDNYEQLKLLIELSLKLAKTDDFHGYMQELSQLKNLDDQMQWHILNHYLEKDPQIQQKIATLSQEKENIRANAVNNDSFKCNIGIIVNTHMDKEYLTTLLSIAVVPIDFSVTIYDLDFENIPIKALFEKNGCKYRNLYYENYQSSAMIIRGEGLDILIDATHESAKNSRLIYAYDNIVECKISLFDAEVKPKTNKLLIADVKNLLKVENSVNIDSVNMDSVNIDPFLSFDPPTFERYIQPPILNTKILTIGMIADKRNTTDDFLTGIGELLQSSKNIRIIFGYKDFIDPTYKKELISHFESMNLLDQIFFLEQNNENTINLKDEFFGYIDIFLNASKIYPEALATSLYMGIPVYYVKNGLSNDALAISILSTMEEYDEYVYDEISACLNAIQDTLNNQDKLMAIRRKLIEFMPDTLLFKQKVSNILFCEKMLEFRGGKNSH